ncbi:hypothetical protein [Noviherbaspirillum galbum]|uniref:Uncharacterized protein n=1 Tax=Noviherbaspirillum galbum TaxID=2709383 RepID=A0A6B3SFD1_9BURK|nr:hypothetical protein [Noviherbaspirillum galbum]NEX59531.1 hypothetical protein [Noviherbaspirillum galbum]
MEVSSLFPYFGWADAPGEGWGNHFAGSHPPGGPDMPETSGSSEPIEGSATPEEPECHHADLVREQPDPLAGHHSAPWHQTAIVPPHTRPCPVIRNDDILFHFE